MVDVDKQIEIITRGTEEIVPKEELRLKIENSIKTNTPLRVKLGVDPTAPDIHLGFTVVIRKMRQLQDLGHKAVLIIGDYTATVGDPTGKNKTREMITHEKVLENAKTYQEQFFKIVNKENCEIVYNGDWFKTLNFEEVIKLSSNITVAKMLERDDFKKRYTAGNPISLHEFMYPLMQGYDSVMIQSDIELGGTDQKFNVLVGRGLQKSNNMSAQVGVFMPILLGTDGKEKMSKSLGNYIGIAESPQSMYHKLINIPDSLLYNYFELLTDVSIDTIKANWQKIKDGKKDAREWKRELAIDITSQYHGKEKALNAEQEEKKVHAGDAIPQDTPVIKLTQSDINIVDFIADNKILPSKGETRRMIKNNGISFNGDKVTDVGFVVNPLPSKDNVLKIGKRKFYKIEK